MDGIEAAKIQKLRDQFKYDEVDEFFAEKEYKQIDVLVKLQKNRVGSGTDLIFCGFKQTEINFKVQNRIFVD